MGGLDWAQGQTSNSALVLLTTNHRNRTGYEKKVPPSEKRTFTTFFYILEIFVSGFPMQRTLPAQPSIALYYISLLSGLENMMIKTEIQLKITESI